MAKTTRPSSSRKTVHGHCSEERAAAVDQRLQARGSSVKTLAVFDLDGTLAESKSAIDPEMGTLLRTLLRLMRVAVISGGDLPQFEEQLLARLPSEAALQNLSLLPTCGTRFYRCTDDWQKLFSEDLSDAQKQKIIGALNGAVAAAGFGAEKTRRKRCSGVRDGRRLHSSARSERKQARHRDAHRGQHAVAERGLDESFVRMRSGP